MITFTLTNKIRSMPKNLILASTSTIYGGGYLDYLLPTLKKHFKSSPEILFIPYARPGGLSYDAYTAIAQKAFRKIDKKVIGIHKHKDPISAIQNAQAIFTGGGNTFELVNQLYKNELMPVLRKVLYDGTPYLGTSAGSNISGLTMQTSNDMPIVFPPSFKTLGMIPFNINPHYQDPIQGDTHMGETRETRINEFHNYNTIPVIGLREGSWLDVSDKTITLQGGLNARVFEKGIEPYEIQSGATLHF